MFLPVIPFISQFRSFVFTCDFMGIQSVLPLILAGNWVAFWLGALLVLTRHNKSELLCAGKACKTVNLRGNYFSPIRLFLCIFLLPLCLRHSLCGSYIQLKAVHSLPEVSQGQHLAKACAHLELLRFTYVACQAPNL